MDSRDIRSRPEDSASRTIKNGYFLPGDGISREVITADICKYLGADALVRPYVHQDVSRDVASIVVKLTSSGQEGIPDHGVSSIDKC